MATGRYASEGMAPPAVPEKAMQVLAKHGVKFIAMEIRHEFQPLADKVANGEMDASQYAQAKADMYRAAGDEGGSSPSKRSVAEAAVIQAAAKYGIKILCVESQASNLKTHGELIDKLDGAKIASENFIESADKEKIINNVKSKKPHNQEQLIVEKLDEQEFKNIASHPFLKNMAREVEETGSERLSGDKRLAQTIKNQTHGQKTIIYYGQSHGTHIGDLHTHLGDPKKIEFYSNEDQLKGVMQNYYMGRQEIPHVAITLDDGKSFSRDQTNKFLHKNIPRLPKEFVESGYKP